MQRFLPFLLGVAFLASAALVVNLWQDRATPEPLAATLPVEPTAEYLNPATSISYYQDRIRRAPDKVQAYAELGQVYLQHARSTAQEAEYLPRAEEVLEAALKRDPDNYHVLLVKGSLMNSLHRFEDAKAIAQQLIERHPSHAFPYGILIDAHVELGEYEEAVAASDRMNAIRPDLASYARASYLRELHGDTEGAIEAMTMAAEAGVAGRENRAWALYNLANLYLGNEDRATARYIYEGLLEERADYPFALAGLGHLAHLDGNYAEAERYFQQAHSIVPNPTFLEFLAETYAASGQDEQAEAIAEQLLDELEEAYSFGENVDMEKADLLADLDRDLDTALRLAEVNYQRRPGHLHTLETLAWTLHKQGRSAEAIPYIEQAMRLDSGDAMVDYRAAHIYLGANQPAQAQKHFALALERNLHIESTTAASDARQHVDA